ncbi:GNAT family N-acetyltransferase [Alteromonas sp. 345S023]|jgi:predicted GNAT family N-acyltransferase|uniref:GNAT family N-acetyltransferase n=1 Tax=Alteromonas profundi TaxID=2696062 RepID=A0A7X5RLE5_9ALTE|nr:GNAT family N-acetyltransferase [Alteromonas profundi]NDV91651.1 GNAT family N-acetyltransferase [Alteromonas profundi]
MTFTIESVDWEQHQSRLKALREHVFVLEWQMPREAEFDERDHHAFHVLVIGENNTPIATGRLTRCGELGRIAVKRKHRHLSVYRALFAALIDLAKQHKVPTVKVNLTLDSVSYHQQLGFKIDGQVFMDGGVPRQKMCCPAERFPLPDVSQMH